jgi:hypothetical protein
VLEEDEDMARMYLTKQHHEEVRASDEVPTPSRRGGGGRDWAAEPHEEVELLLENYAQELGAAIALLELLSYSIESDEKFFSYRLDAARNRLLKVDVMATIGATAMGAGSMAASILGMNLETPIFEMGATRPLHPPQTTAGLEQSVTPARTLHGLGYANRCRTLTPPVPQTRGCSTRLSSASCWA